jgi:hypothetical protein
MKSLLLFMFGILLVSVGIGGTRKTLTSSGGTDYTIYQGNLGSMIGAILFPQDMQIF